MTGTTISTVRDLIDHGMGATIYCVECERGVAVDLEALAAKVGRDWVYVAKRWPFRCQCGARENRVSI